MSIEEMTGRRSDYCQEAKAQRRRLIAAEAAITQSYELIRKTKSRPRRALLEKRLDFAHAVALDATEKLSFALAFLCEVGMKGLAKEMSEEVIQASWKAKKKAKLRVVGPVGPDI